MSSLRARSGGADDLRTARWRGNAATALVSPAAPGRPAPVAVVSRCLARLAEEGYRAALTTALGPADQAPFLDAGFAVHERLHLLVHHLDPVPPAPAHRLRRARRADRAPVLALDAAAFPPFWRLDGLALDDALAATPSARFRVGPAPGPPVGYAITGRAGPRGYLQRLAVDPAHRRSGLGSALVVDGLRWARRWGARQVLVNTQEDNDGALAAYLHLGFELRPDGLAVLRRELAPT